MPSERQNIDTIILHPNDDGTYHWMCPNCKREDLSLSAETNLTAYCPNVTCPGCGFQFGIDKRYLNTGDLVTEARELLEKLPDGARLKEADLAPLLSSARAFLRQLCDEVERGRKALKQMVTLWDDNNPDDPCGCMGASDDCKYPPTCELCVARMVMEGRNPADEY